MREPNAFCSTGPPGKDIFCKLGLNWCWALENSGPLPSIMAQLGASVALDHPSFDSIFALALHSQFYFVLFVKSKFRRKKNCFFFFSPLFFCVLLVFQPGIYSSMAHPTQFQNALKGAICGFPLLIYFRKTLQSDINCFDCMHLFIITGCCLTLLPSFFLSFKL